MSKDDNERKPFGVLQRKDLLALARANERNLAKIPSM